MPRMFKLAFSTVSCPEWTLQRVARAAIESNFEGVELRTFGTGSGLLPCDPALTAPGKVVNLFTRNGVEITGLATSSRFDARVSPPVLGWALGDFEKEVREAKRHLDLAAAIGAEYVRVFAFEPAPGERRSAAMSRIVKRLQLVCDDARNKGVVVALENGGGYTRAAQVAEIIDAVESPLLRAGYNVALGASTGDDPAEAVETLGERLLVARFKDHRRGAPCLPGDGDVPCEAFARALAMSGLRGWAVFEWDRLWAPKLAPAVEILPKADARLSGWLYQSAAKEPARVGV